MKMSKSLLLSIVCFLAVYLTACSGPFTEKPGETASVTINLGGEPMARATGFCGLVGVAGLELTFELTLIDWENDIHIPLQVNAATGTATRSGLSPGSYSIIADAYVNGWPYAFGDTDQFTLTAGQNRTVPVTMGRIPEAIALSIPKGQTYSFPNTVLNGTPQPLTINVYNFTNDLNITLTSNSPNSSDFTIGVGATITIPQDTSVPVIITPTVTSAGVKNINMGFTWGIGQNLTHAFSALVYIDGGAVTTFTGLDNAIKTISSEPGPRVVTIGADIDFEDSIIFFNNDPDIILITDGTQRILRRAQGFLGPLFTINAGRLQLGHRDYGTSLTITGGHVDDIVYPLIEIENSSFPAVAILEINGGVSIIANYFSAIYSFGTVIMNNGLITGNTIGTLPPQMQGGGAVNIRGGSFSKYGGSIHGNNSTQAEGGAGLVFAPGSTITFGRTASIISNNHIVSGQNIPSNVRIDTGNFITLGTGVNAPANGMNVGVTLVPSGEGVFVNSGAWPEHAAFFESDTGGTVVHDGMQLRIEL